MTATAGNVLLDRGPGIYLPGRFGDRIEGIGVATEEGGRRLSNSSHEMRIVS